MSKQNLLKKKQIMIFVLCWLGYASIYLCRVNLSVAMPSIQADLGFSKTQLGLMGSSFLWIYGVGHIINGFIGDRVSSKRYIFVGISAAALCNLILGFTSNITAFTILWAINGFVQSMVWGPMVKALAAWFPRRMNSKVATGISTSMTIGYMAAWALSMKLIGTGGWRLAFWVPGTLVLGFSVVWLVKFRDTPQDMGIDFTDEDEEEVPPQGISKYTLWQVVVKTKLWFIVLACMAQGVIKDGISLWGPTYLLEMHSLSMDSMGMIMLIPIMNFFGVLFAGWLNKRMNNNEKASCGILLLIGAAMLVGLVKLGTSSVLVATLFLGGASAAMYGANCLLLGIVPMKFSKYGKASSTAGFLDFASYLSAGVAASLTGWIAEGSGWNGVLLLWLAVVLVGVVSLALSMRFARED